MPHKNKPATTVKEPLPPDSFEQWIKSEQGQGCLQWPITDPVYLRNRLWWAFHAGVGSMINHPIKEKS